MWFARGWSVPRLKLRSLTELQAKLGDTFKKCPGICQKRKLESNECDTNRISLKEQLWMPTNKCTPKVNKGKSRKWCETCLKLTVNTPERRYCSRSGVFIVNFDMFHIFFCCFYCWLWASRRSKFLRAIKKKTKLKVVENVKYVQKLQ